jgi:GH35 family endo-1,4-beta-xylanase
VLVRIVHVEKDSLVLGMRCSLDAMKQRQQTMDLRAMARAPMMMDLPIMISEMDLEDDDKRVGKQRRQREQFA